MLLLLALVALVGPVTCAKVGIVHIHGVLEGYYDSVNFKKFIERNTGIPVHLVNAYNYAASLTPLQHQVKDILPRVQAIAANYDKVIAVGYSQGGVVWRGLIESWDNHNVETFISLASPQHGVYIAPSMVSKYIPFLDRYSKTTIYKIIYTIFGQSIAMFNYYMDPTHYEMYLEKCPFFSELNNEHPSLTSEEKERQKRNFLRLQKLVLIGGPTEDVIDPWQSTMFGYYTEEGFEGDVVPMEQTKLYGEDLFGLKTLDERGGVERCQFDGITHLQFRDNQDMMKTCILPVLEHYMV